MTQDTIKKIEEKIHKDGSLSEERKTELLNLLLTMQPEEAKKNMPNSSKIHKDYNPVYHHDRFKM